MRVRLLPARDLPVHELARPLGVGAEMQRARRVGAGRIGLEARIFRIEAAAELVQRRVHAGEHVTHDLGLHRVAVHLLHDAVLVFDTDLVAERLLEADRPLRIDDAAHVRLLVRVAVEAGAAIDVGTVGRQMMHVAAILVGLVLAAPAVLLVQVLHHLGRELDHEVGAARIRESHVEVAVLRIHARGGADDLAHEIDRKARLWGVQEIEVAEVCDLDPALALLLAQLDEQRRVDRAEPGRDHEGRLLDQRHRLRRAVVELRGRRHELARKNPARIGDAGDGVDHAAVEQRVAQEQHVVARPDGVDLDQVVDGLEVVAGLCLRQDRRRRHRGRVFGIDDVGIGGRAESHDVSSCTDIVTALSQRIGRRQRGLKRRLAIARS